MSARRPWARPLVPVYRAGLWAKDRLRSVLQTGGLLRPKRLAWPVVSVGSLSAGGAGKTPVVIALAKMLRGRGWCVDVLSRGYGRSGRGVERLVGEDAARFGDEPVVIAQRAGVPVWVGANRFAAGTEAERCACAEPEAEPARRMHLLDDGMQHRRLARSVEVVLLTVEDLDDKLLPAGNLREDLRSLQRANVIVVRSEEMEAVAPRLKGLMREGTLVWTVRRRLEFPGPANVFGAGLRPVAFCAIARPEGFAAMLLEAGCGVVETVFFDDHHAYAMVDIERVVEVAGGLKATGLVTTEKDAVKLSAAMLERLETVGPVMVVGLEAEFVFPERVARELERRLTAGEMQPV